MGYLKIIFILIIFKTGYVYPQFNFGDFTIPPEFEMNTKYIAVHQALIIPRNMPSTISNSICSGVLISNFTLLTSASCLLKTPEQFYTEQELDVLLGMYGVVENSAIAPTRVQIGQLIPHGRFNKQTFINNIALIKVDTVAFSANVVPAPTSRNSVFDSMSCVVLKWDEAGLPVIQNITTQINRVCRTNKFGQSYPLETFCSGDANTLDSCVGEEGGALICDNMLQGLITSTCDENKATQYIDVSKFFFWGVTRHLNSNDFKLIDNEYLRYVLFGSLDFIAWQIGTPDIADMFELVKFLF